MMVECLLIFEQKHIQRFCSKDTNIKFETIKEDIRVGGNRSLKWCPTPDCGGTVAKPGICTNKSSCEKCKQAVCFKCGGLWHRGKCRYAGNTAFYIWQSANPNVASCPFCRTITKKEGGCNHITCYRCQQHWCWICRSKLDKNNYYRHWDGMFGCIGLKDSCDSYIMILLLQLFFLPFLPIIVYFLLMRKAMKAGLWRYYIWIYNIVYQQGERDSEESVAFSLMFCFLVGTSIMVLMLPVTLVVSPVVMLVQLFRLVWAFSIRFLCCWCCN
jgi:hypothetical protein